MKSFVIALLFITVTGESFAQWLTQSAEGNGSFLFKGANVSLDLLKTDLSITLNNLHNPVKISNKDNHFLFFGGGMDAKAKKGLGNLFTNRDLVPAGELNLYLGFQFANSYNKLYQVEELRLSAQTTKIKIQQVADFVIKINGKIDEKILSSHLTDSVVIKKIKKEWKEKLSKSYPNAFFEYLKTYKPDNVSVANIIPDLLVSVETMMRENALDLEHITNLLTGNREENIRNKLWRFSIFVIGGADASSFNRVEKLDSNNFANSFIKEDYYGNFVAVGMNFQISKLKIGATYAYRKTNNFGLLDNLYYKLNTAITANGQTLNQEKTVNAFTGAYGEVVINELNADIMYTLDLGDNSDAHALLNAYFRGQLFSRSKDLLPATYNVGIGTYFYTRKSRFLGGIYIELPDVNNYFKKNKSGNNQTLTPATQRLAFGLVGKYSLNALFSHQ